MPKTYEPIATNTLGSNASSVTFSSIPSTYTDLVLSINYIASGGGVYSQLRINSDGGSNYSRIELLGNGSSAYAQKLNNENWLYNSVFASSGNRANALFHFMNYSNTTTFKTVLSRLNAPQNTLVQGTVSLWRSTSAINSINIQANANNFGTGSSFTLYGIKAA
jgi:hypothetical protein